MTRRALGLALLTCLGSAATQGAAMTETPPEPKDPKPRNPKPARPYEEPH